ncbi:MAG: T9SS type A sorting domain-containing protein [Bacteroidetes bacterium]|nr:T9SS type A sorting domain-containing protein [Bacteroidota bacterium]
MNFPYPTQPLRITVLVLSFVLTLLTTTMSSSAQCTGCTSSISNNGSAITANSGDVICIVTNGTFNKAITINSGGTVCISPQSTVTSSITVGSGATLIVNGTYSGSFTQNSGSTVTVNSGADFRPSSATFNGGAFTSAGSVTLPNGVNISSNMTAWTSSGALTTGSFTNNGANIVISGGPVSMGSVTANNGSGSMTFNTAVTMTGFTENAGGATNFNGGVTINGSATVNGPVNVNGNMTVTGTLTNNSGPITETATSGCYTLTVGTASGYGTIDGGGSGFEVLSSSGNYTLSNGAYSAPTQSPTNLHLPLSGTTVSGDFSRPSASISGYIVLRYVGTAATADAPTNGTSYNVGDVIGSSTVIALVSGGSTSTAYFTDVISTSMCSKKSYYRIFSYGGYGSCPYVYKTSSPLTGYVSLTSMSVSMTASGPTTFCSGGSVTLTSSAATSYSWSTGATSQSISPTTSGTYTVTATTSGCTGTASQSVTVNTAPAAAISGTTSICSGSSTTLTASGGTGYVWSTGATTAAITTAASGTYRVTVTNASGCTATASSTVTVNALPAAAISGTTTICSGSSTTLTASGGTGYVWSTGATAAAIAVSSAATYRVTVTNAAGCTATASGTVTVNANPTASISGTTSICSGSSTTLTASGGTGYVWSTTATTAAIAVSSAATYRVTVTNASGCTATASSTVTVNANPTASISGTTAICSGSSTTLTAGTGTGYVWSTTATTAAISVSSAATYRVTVTNAASCTATASSTVTVYSLPSVTASAASPICSGSTLSLTAVASGSASYTYAWTGPNSFTATAATPSINNATTAATGSYTVTVTDNHSCTATAAASATVANCHTVSGKIFDDADGNGIKAASEPATTYGNTMYGILADSATGNVLQVVTINGSGTFSFSGIMPGTSGLRVRVGTTAPSVGAAAPATSWPAGWVSTLGQYGTGDPAHSGVSTDTTGTIAVSVGSSDVTGILIGYDQLPSASSRAYTVTKPNRNASWKLNAAHGVGLLAGTDPEDGPLGVGHKFIVTSLAGMNGNKLYYDADGNTTLAAYEQITGYTVITSFDSSKLYMVFTGYASTSASFSYSTVDAAGKSTPTPSTYNINWQVALPVKLISFDAQQTNDNRIQLQWATASEINNDHFDVERSADAQAWSKIAEVKGAGNTNEMQQYALTDRQPLSGINYYRLRQVDYDGKYEYSDIAAAEISTAAAITMTVYPNPAAAGKGLNIVLAGGADAIRYVRITDLSGTVVYGAEVGDEQSHRVQGLDLPAGIYTVTTIANTGARYSSKVTVQ